MINQEFDFEELLDFIEGFLSENFAVVVIIFLLILVGLFVFVKYLYERRGASRKQLLRKWGSLKARHEKLTNRLTLKIYPFGAKNFNVKGEIFVIDSRIHEREYQVKELISQSVKGIDEQIQRIEKDKERYQEKHPSCKPTELEQFDKIITVLKEEKERFNQQKGKKKDDEKITIKDKTETYIALDKNDNKIVGIRYTDLKPTQSILSQTGFLELSRIDPRRSNWIFFLFIGVLIGFEFILTWALFSEVEPDFLFEANMWGWYAALGLTMGFVIYIIRVLMGFYAIVYAKQTTREDIQLVTPKGEPFTVNIEIYWVQTYFYPNINVAEVLDINVDSLAKQVNQDNRKLISELSTENATIRGELDFVYSMLNKKSEIIDRIEERLLTERALGYYEGRQDNSAAPMLDEEHRLGLGVDWTVVLYRSIPFVFGLIGLVIMAFAVKFISDSIELTEVQMTLLLIVGGLLIGGFVLIALRSVFESTRRSAVG